MISPWIAFLAWIPITLYFFRAYPVRVAILVNFVAGWALLPSARYVPTTARFPYWILGTCLPSSHIFTKATVVAMTGFLGIVLFDRRIFTHLKLSFWDLPILAWCFVPLLSAIANLRGFVAACQMESYQILAWGVPYLIGRLYFSDTESLRLAVKALVVAGLAYVPVCLTEIFIGPQIYAHLYGYQPYRWVGADRYLGFRPVGLLEDGNQLAIWMATSTLLAIWLWRRRLVDRILGIPIAGVSAVLLVVTLLCQSAESILVLLCLLPFVFVRKSSLPRAVVAIFLLGALGYMSLRLANVISLRMLVKQNAVAHSAEDFLRSIKRQSFGWRLSEDEKHVGVALEKPLLGYGEWNWWRNGLLRPWGLWLLAFGMYGIVGLLALECLQLLPAARVLWFSAPRTDMAACELRSAIAAVVLMSAIDNLLNGSMNLPLCLLIGGLSAPHGVVSAVRQGFQSRATIFGSPRGASFEY
jgi:hypothetical protein